jgi:hypothetical protein
MAFSITTFSKTMLRITIKTPNIYDSITTLVLMPSVVILSAIMLNAAWPNIKNFVYLNLEAAADQQLLAYGKPRSEIFIKKLIISNCFLLF